MRGSAKPRYIVDANLLTLLVVGRSDRHLIANYKRTNRYSAAEFDRLSDLLSQSVGIVSTPNILTEVSNLLNHAKGLYRGLMYEKLSELIGQLEELYVPSQALVAAPSFSDFGLTDLGIVQAARQTEAVALTDDMRLAVELASQDIHTLNFNHLR